MINECDRYRHTEEVLKPDSRGVALFSTTDMENWNKIVDKRLQPSDDLPLNIRIQIENIKNLLLYSWFVYRFAIVAKTQMFNITELALSEKFKAENLSAPRGLKNKLNRAQDLGWIDVCGLNDDQDIHPAVKNKRVKSKITAMGDLRNSFNHGSDALLPPVDIIRGIQHCLYVVNSLFEEQ